MTPARAASPSQAAPGSVIGQPFTDGLSADDRRAIGVDLLTPPERAALNEQVARELALARQGNVRGFAKTFTQRRTPADLTATGLEKLSPEQRTALDRSIAWAMAVPLFLDVQPRFTPSDAVQTVKPKARIHGEMSATVGVGSGGRSMYGGSMAVTYEDPNRGLSTTVRVSQYKGDGWIFYDDGYGPAGYGYGPALGYGYPFSDYELNGTQREIGLELRWRRP